MVVEDGTGLPNADSYASVAAADAYFLARGNATWAAALTADKESALVRATQSLDGRCSWRGVRLTSAQGLRWPRALAIDDDGYSLDGVPLRLRYATIEAAVVELGKPGALTTALARGGQIRREKVGEIEIEYSGGAPVKTAYPAVDGYLSALVESGGLKVQRVP
jgi:hypothetical protein